MVVNLVEIKCHVFLDVDYYFHHFCSQAIRTFQERAINDALYVTKTCCKRCIVTFRRTFN